MAPGPLDGQVGEPEAEREGGSAEASHLKTPANHQRASHESLCGICHDSRGSGCRGEQENKGFQSWSSQSTKEQMDKESNISCAWC
jgi:cytochrome c